MADEAGPVVDFNDHDAMRAAGLGHLLPDAPYRVCSACRRHTWASPEGEVCGMLQPDGSRCAGVFGAETHPAVRATGCRVIPTDGDVAALSFARGDLFDGIVWEGVRWER